MTIKPSLVPSTTQRCSYEITINPHEQTTSGAYPDEQPRSPCPEPVFGSSSHCILHLELPDKDDPEFETIFRAKKARTQEKIDVADFNFEAAQLVEFSAEGKDIDKANFYKAKFYGDAVFDKAKFYDDALFDKATFSGNAWFGGATFIYARFNLATFSKGADFRGATFSNYASFVQATFRDLVWFDRTEFPTGVWALLTIFDDPQSQEELCRVAKQSWDRIGNRSEADHYFYREMEAKRKQKTRFWRWLELPAQYIFGYGVHPERLFASFVIVLVAFGIFYWPQGVPWVQGVPASSPLSSFYFSFTTMLLPGSGLLNPQPGIAGVAVIVQALFGLLVWGTFIATLTRQFGR